MPIDPRLLPPMLAGVALLAVAIGTARFVGSDGDPGAGDPAGAAEQAEPRPPAETPSPEVAAEPETEAEAADLRARLDAEVAAVATLAQEHAAALADRDAEIERLGASLAESATEREALQGRVEALETELAARLGEIAALEAELGLAAARPSAIDPAKFLDPEKIPLSAGLHDPAVFAVPVPAPDRPSLRPAVPRPMAAPRATAAIPDAAPAPPPPADALLAEIHFELASAALTPGGRERAVEAAAVIAALDPALIRVTGHADRTGSAAANARLSRARAEAVVALLVEGGVPADRIELAAYGADEAMLPIPTGPGVAEPLNRCVGIWLEPMHAAGR